MTASPSPHDFDQIVEKLRRAEEHVQTLRTIHQQFLTSGFFRTGAMKQDRKGRLPYGIIDVDPWPVEWGIVAGECVHQIRSALDHLAFLLAKPVGEAQEGAVQFPIMDRRVSFRAGATRRLPGIPRGARTAFEQVQPYHQRKWPDTRRLAQLRDLDNWSKHRTLIPAIAAIDESRLNVRIVGSASVRRIISVRGRVEPGAVFARLEMGASEVGTELYVHPELALLAVFDRHGPSNVREAPVTDTLSAIRQFVEFEVVPRFARFV